MIAAEEDVEKQDGAQQQVESEPAEPAVVEESSASTSNLPISMIGTSEAEAPSAVAISINETVVNEDLAPQGTELSKEEQDRFVKLIAARLKQHLEENGSDADPHFSFKLKKEDVEILTRAFGANLENAPESMLSNIQDAKDVMSILGLANTLLRARKDWWPVHVAFKDLSYTVKVEKSSMGIQTVGNQFAAMFSPLVSCLTGCRSTKEDIHILNQMSGAFRAGVPTLVLGPPGCGVTTLFKALSGHLKVSNTHTISGTTLYSGYSSEEVKVRKLANYVEQIDCHFPVLTVQETTDFAFNCLHDVDQEKENLANPDSTPEERQKAVENFENFPSFLIQNMGLNNCKDTIIGNHLIRGVSGGERRRVTLVEMLTARRPFTLYDQISTGLDSAATFDISKQICDVSRILSTTAVVALLQPPPEVFDLFDEILILNGGRVLFHGPRANVLPYFESIGFKCPEDKDIADFIQEVTTDMRSKYQVLEAAPKNDIEMAEAWQASPFSEKKREEIETWTNPANKVDSPFRVKYFSMQSRDFARKFKDELALVISRQRQLVYRDKAFVKARIGQSIVMGTIMGTVFLNLSPDVGVGNFIPITQRYGLVFSTLMQASLTSMAMIPVIIQSRSIYYKQESAYFFRTISYVIAETITTIPISIVECIFMGSLIFWLTALVPRDAPDVASQYFCFLAFLFLLNISFGSFLRTIGAFAPNESVGQVIAGVSIAFCILFSGFIITPNNIPGWFIWIYWMTPMSWTLRAEMIYVFSSWGDAAQAFALGLFQFQNEIGYIWGAAILLVGYLLLDMLMSSLFYKHLQLEKSNNQQTVKVDVGLEDDSEDLKVAEDSMMQKTDLEKENSSHLVLQMRADSVSKLEGKCRTANLVFRNLWYTVPNPSNKRETIDLLKGVSGYAQAGTMTALMGSSGAGKTTLMDVIAGRKNSGEIKGDILVNGRPKNNTTFSRIIGYVEQMDIHSPHQTVEEALMFSAKLRQGDEVPQEEKETFVKAVIEALELEAISGFEIGDRETGGLSVEQAKRVTIGVEMAANPSILFADEPTSGLDARAAAIVMRGIKRVAMSGRTVVCTIHQPSRDIFQNFDRLLLLKRGGEVVFFGDLGAGSKNLLDYFNAITGKSMPSARYNPATFMLEVIGAGTQAAAVKTDFAKAYSESQLCKQAQQEIQSLVDIDLSDREEIVFDSRFASNFGTQQKELMIRWLKTYWRSPSYNFTRIMVNIVMALLFGTAFLQVEVTNTTQVQSLLGLIFMSAMFLGIINLNSTVPVMFTELSPYNKERAANMYGITPYIVALTLAELPYIVIVALIFMVIFYFLVGLSKGASVFFLYWVVFFLYMATQTFLGQLLATATPNQQVAGILAGVLTGLSSLFAGFTISVEAITPFWQFMTYINPIRYAFAALVQVQLDCNCVFTSRGINGPICTSGSLTDSCSVVCDQNSLGCSVLNNFNGTAKQYSEAIWGFDYATTNSYIGAVVGFVVGFRILTVVALLVFNFQKR